MSIESFVLSLLNDLLKDYIKTGINSFTLRMWKILFLKSHSQDEIKNLLSTYSVAALDTKKQFELSGHLLDQIDQQEIDTYSDKAVGIECLLIISNHTDKESISTFLLTALLKKKYTELLFYISHPSPSYSSMLNMTRNALYECEHKLSKNNVSDSITLSIYGIPKENAQVFFKLHKLPKRYQIILEGALDECECR